MRELNSSWMLAFYKYQLLWNNRQNYCVYDAFVNLWDREELWVTIDRANLNSPNRHGRDLSGFIHWDTDNSLTPLLFNVQGFLHYQILLLKQDGSSVYPHFIEIWKIGC